MTTSYSERLESFKSNSLCPFLKQKDLTRPGYPDMAKCFYRYSPTFECIDNVVCEICHTHVSGFSHFTGNPIEKHANLGHGCIMEAFGRLCKSYRLNGSLNEMELFEWKITCVSTFGEEFLLSEKLNLSSKGFFCTRKLNTSKNLACMMCLYETRKIGKAEHKQGCMISELLTEFEPNEEGQPYEEVQSQIELTENCESSELSEDYGNGILDTSSDYYDPNFVDMWNQPSSDICSFSDYDSVLREQHHVRIEDFPNLKRGKFTDFLKSKFRKQK